MLGSVSVGASLYVLSLVSSIAVGVFLGRAIKSHSNDDPRSQRKTTPKLSDALNYIFKEDVYPIFRELTLEQKHLRDEESVEMLDILIESAVPNYTDIFSLDTSGFYSNLASQLRGGNSAVASVVASNENALKAAVDKVNNAE
jgi:hypothetical protein